MSLNRKFLKALGIEDDKADQIIEEHTSTVDRLTAENKTLQEKVNTIPTLQKELEEAKKAAKDSGNAAEIQKAFDDYKADVKAKETKAAKEMALRKVAKDAGLTETGIAKVVKYTDYASIDLDDKGEIKTAKDLIKTLRAEWPEHLNKTTTTGAETPNPNGGGGGGDDGGANSRAAQLYKAHYAALYGQENTSSKGENNK